MAHAGFKLAMRCLHSFMKYNIWHYILGSIRNGSIESHVVVVSNLLCISTPEAAYPE